MVYPWPESSPILLTDKGKEEVIKSAKELKKEKIDIIFSSDISRTKQTAEIVGKEINKKIILDIRLRDISFGIFAGKEKKEYKSFFAEKKEKFIKRPLYGENWLDLRERTRDFIEEIEGKYKNKKILIVSHGDTLMFLEAFLKGVKNNEYVLNLEMMKTGEIRKI